MTTILSGIEFGEKLRLEPWDDPVIEALGHDPRSVYVERFWLPVLGPSTIWLLRLFATRLEQAPSGCLLDVAETAKSLGLGERSGRHAPFLRTLARAIDFEMATLKGPGRLAVRRSLPPLARRHLVRLPESLREEHERLTNDEAIDTAQLRGRRLALSLLELGESQSEAERQLIRWRFHPALAARCAQWAQAEREHELASRKEIAPATSVLGSSQSSSVGALPEDNAHEVRHQLA